MDESIQIPDRVERARCGDQAAWESLYRDAYPRLVAFASHRLGSVDEARDAVSETMARAVAQIDRYTRDDNGFIPWLFGILRHVVADTQRRQHRCSPGEIPDRAADLPDPLDRLVRLDQARALRRAMERLDPEERELIELRVVAGLSSDQVALAMDKKPSAIRMAQMRALGRLRTFVEEAERVG